MILLLHTGSIALRMQWYCHVETPFSKKVRLFSAMQCTGRTGNMQLDGKEGKYKKVGGKEGLLPRLLTLCKAPCSWTIIPD